MLLHGAPFFQTYPHNLYGCGRAREKTIAVRRNPSPKQNAALRNSGQGTMSLAGAGQSPQSFTASAVSADRRNLFPHKQVADLRPIAVRQSNAARRNPSLQAKRSFAPYRAAVNAAMPRNFSTPNTPPPQGDRRRQPPPAPLPSKIPHALCNPPMVFRSSNPCPARFFCKKDFTTFFVQTLDILFPL